MKTVHKSVLIWYSAEEMYALVTDVAKYPEFLPWCDRAKVIEHSELGMTAEVGLAFSGFHQQLHHPQHPRAGPRGAPRSWSTARSPTWTASGPSRRSARTGERACRVELNLSYGFSNFALQALVGPVFDKVASNLVEAFVKRAEQVYGDA